MPNSSNQEVQQNRFHNGQLGNAVPSRRTQVSARDFVIHLFCLVFIYIIHRYACTVATVTTYNRAQRMAEQRIAKDCFHFVFILCISQDLSSICCCKSNMQNLLHSTADKTSLNSLTERACS